MHPAITEILKKYNCQNPHEYKNALKEIMQEIALLGLSRQNFFYNAAFYGGTALRIAHQLNRFSEDLDFTLIKANLHFDINPFLKSIEEEFISFGLKLTSEKKVKAKDSGIESAFLKANTLEHLLMIEKVNNTDLRINKNEVIKIKLEIDTNPPTPPGKVETLFLTEPIPFSYQILTLPSLFAGKLHAILCREYLGNRVKGRDYYDFIWYINKQVEPDLEYLKGKLVESGKWDKKNALTNSELKKQLKEKFISIDWVQAKKDISPFISDTKELEVWSTAFFQSLLSKL